MGTTQIIAEPGTQQIEIIREFDAARELVFRAHTEPDLLVQWLGPRGLTMHVDHFEARNGGTWRYTHRDANGTEYGFHGVFHGTPSVDRIVQTFEFEGAPGHVSLESLTLEEIDGRTRLHALSVFQSVTARDAMIESGMEGGVKEGYERLDELIASRRGQVSSPRTPGMNR
ncbi:MAG TPA: SRPBCC family protein [Thermomicrobiales bacterium]|nr:SRPBCC family protein [Thermomicrobiales bacterium]